MQLVRYTPSLHQSWNDCLAGSRNGTFILDRRFMDYHAERFVDASLLFYKKKKIIGLLPASLHGCEVVSHGGLTYGGFVVDASVHANDVGEMMELALQYYRSQGIRRFTLKPIPYIYHKQPADDELYWLFRHNAVLTARGLSSAVNLQAPLPFSSLRNRKTNLAKRQGLIIQKNEQADDYGAFWDLLSHVLLTQHGKRPVHSLEEILLLRERFPENIILHTVRHPETSEMLAGTLLFVTHNVVHAQYIASSEQGRIMGALDGLFHKLISDWSTLARTNGDSPHYFDFGISTENHGTIFNEGLNFQKEGFGARSIVYDAYTIEL